MIFHFKINTIFTFSTLFILLSVNLSAQNRNNIWCFGDSAGIDFNNGAVAYNSSLNSRGSCVSYCNTSGQLILYASTGWADIFTNFPFSTKIFNANDSLIFNGDSIRGDNWYKELVMLPMPNDTLKYYLFSAGVTAGLGFSYSIVDMSLNGGLGAVVQKNILLQSFPCTDGISAIKHGNGRDWWIIFRRWDNVNNEYYKYLVSPTGISNVIIQNIGSATINGFTNMNFSRDGSKMSVSNLAGLMEIYDFDRCTGIISNTITIHPEPTTAPYGRFVGCEFSESGRFLYVSTYDTGPLSALFQYDLWSSNPAANRDTLEYIPGLRVGNGFLRRGPDQKIYFSRAWECDAFPDCYPYPDSVYNQINMNLSVINYPDSLGAACGYAPYSFYLGGKRTYYGLPNNPDYDLPTLTGSLCDSLTSISEFPIISESELFVYYSTYWQTAFINANKLKGTHYRLSVYDVMGKKVFSEAGKLTSPYFTKNLNCNSFNSGMYVVKLETEKEKLVRKFLVDN